MYIGIIGYSGDDKVKLSKLYGNTLNWIMNHRDEKEPSMDYIREYMSWCDSLKDENMMYINAETDATFINNNIYYASFSHPLKTIVSMITGVPFTLLSSHESKSSYIINIRTFEYKKDDGSEYILNPEKLFKQRTKKLTLEYSDKQELPDGWVTLNDYVIYFGYYLCRNYLGKDVWVNVERMSNKKFPPSRGTVRIYTDIRSMSEYNYIKEMGGVLVRVNQKDCEHNSVVNDLDLFNVDVDIEMGDYSTITTLFTEIYMNCLAILAKCEITQ